MSGRGVDQCEEHLNEGMGGWERATQQWGGSGGGMRVAPVLCLLVWQIRLNLTTCNTFVHICFFVGTLGCPSQTCFFKKKYFQPIPMVFGGCLEGSQKDFWFGQVLRGAHDRQKSDPHRQKRQKSPRSLDSIRYHTSGVPPPRRFLPFLTMLVRFLTVLCTP